MNLATVIWNMDPVAFSIGSLELRWYSLLFVTAFIAGATEKAIPIGVMPSFKKY